MTRTAPAAFCWLILLLLFDPPDVVADRHIEIVLTPRDYVDPTKVDGYVCGVAASVDPERMIAEKNSAFIFDLLGASNSNPSIGQAYKTQVFDVAYYDAESATNVTFDLPPLRDNHLISLFLVSSSAQCNQLTFKDAAEQRNVYLPVYMGTSSIPEDVIAFYEKLEPNVKNHFGMSMPKLCGAKVLMGRAQAALSRSKAMVTLFNFAFNSKRALHTDPETSCTTKESTTKSIHDSTKIDTAASFAFPITDNKVEDTKGILESIVTRSATGQISVVYVEPVFQAPSGKVSAGPSDIVDRSWPVVFNKTSQRSSSFLLINDDNDGNETFKLMLKPVGTTRKKRMASPMDLDEPQSNKRTASPSGQSKSEAKFQKQDSLLADYGSQGSTDIMSQVTIMSQADVQLEIILPDDGQVKVYTIPVGQGDSSVIQCPNGDISIIDMGCLGGCTMTAETYSEEITRLFFEDDDIRYERLKHIFFTHPDADHINFALNTGTQATRATRGFLYNIRNTAPATTRTRVHFGAEAGWQGKQWFPDFLRGFGGRFDVVHHEKVARPPGIAAHPTTWTEPRIRICDDADIDLQIIASDIRIQNTEPNERSMVMSLQVEAQKKMLFMGDFQGEREYAILTDHYSDQIEGHEVWMVPHHGSDTHGNGENYFFELVKGNQETSHIFQAIISSALWGTHNHPRGNALEAICDPGFTPTWPGIGSKGQQAIIQGWFKVHKYHTRGHYLRYVDVISESNQCGLGNLVHQTTKVNFETAKRRAFTYVTTLSNPALTAQETVTAHPALMLNTFEIDGHDVVRHTGNIGHL